MQKEIFWTEKTSYVINPWSGCEGDSSFIPSLAINILYDSQILISNLVLHTQFLNGAFLTIVLVSISRLVALVIRKHVLYDFSPLTIIETCFMTQHVNFYKCSGCARKCSVCARKCSVCARKECAFCSMINLSIALLKSLTFLIFFLLALLIT